MGIAHLAARSMFATVFVRRGFAVYQNAEQMAGVTDDLLDKVPAAVRDALPEVPAVTLTKIQGATMTAAGAALGLGVFPRLSALVLAAQMVPTTYMGHPFWKHEGNDRVNQQIHFEKNVSLTGGLLVTALGGAKKQKKARKTRAA
jgi:putative oxidoreductase